MTDELQKRGRKEATMPKSLDDIYWAFFSCMSSFLWPPVVLVHMLFRPRSVHSKMNKFSDEIKLNSPNQVSRVLATSIKTSYLERGHVTIWMMIMMMMIMMIIGCATG